MNTCIYSIDDLNVDLKSIVRQIELESYSPELILSVNRGGCIPGIYLSHYLKVSHLVVNIQLRDGESNKKYYLQKKDFLNKKRVLIVDDINDTGKTFEEIKKITTKIDCEIKLCALLDNVQSTQKIDFRGKSINKSTDPLWYIFPWENWW
tara:strand:+ start:117 stop:566 length:450 start_codon:yes stop_codon:yes gene_type:complete